LREVSAYQVQLAACAEAAVGAAASHKLDKPNSKTNLGIGRLLLVPFRTLAI
jgi:hypothetical protein